MKLNQMGMDQYLLIPFLGEWTSIYQLFWGSLGTRVLTHPQISGELYADGGSYRSTLPNVSLKKNRMFHYKPSTLIGWYWHIRQNDLGKPRMPSSGFIFAFCSAVLCQPLLIALGQPADVAYTSARYAQVQWLGVGQRSWYQHGFYLILLYGNKHQMG